MPDQKEQETALQDAEPQIAQPTAEKEQETLLQDAEPQNANPTDEQQLRRSARITGRPKALNDYVLY